MFYLFPVTFLQYVNKLYQYVYKYTFRFEYYNILCKKNTTVANKKLKYTNKN